LHDDPQSLQQLGGLGVFEQESAGAFLVAAAICVLMLVVAVTVVRVRRADLACR
jgi:hypothetical protein